MTEAAYVSKRTERETGQRCEVHAVCPPEVGYPRRLRGTLVPFRIGEAPAPEDLPRTEGEWMVTVCRTGLAAVERIIEDLAAGYPGPEDPEAYADKEIELARRAVAAGRLPRPRAAGAVASKDPSEG